jgi:hypothetical protein
MTGIAAPRSFAQPWIGLRDLVSVGAIDRVYVHSPDRLARNYAYQVLLLDKWQRRGIEVAKNVGKARLVLWRVAYRKGQLTEIPRGDFLVLFAPAHCRIVSDLFRG